MNIVLEIIITGVLIIYDVRIYSAIYWGKCSRTNKKELISDKYATR